MKLLGANSSKKEGLDGILFTIMFIMLLAIVLLIGAIYKFVYNGSQLYILWTAIIMLLVLATIGVLLFIAGFTLFLLWYNRNIPKPMVAFAEFFIPLLYPVLEGMGKALGYDKNKIRRAYTSINNRLVYSKGYSFRGEEILVLSPHCIQKNSCPHKLTVNVRNCTGCGKCPVKPLLELTDKYKVKFSLVSGGTIARRIIKENNPEAIIAIACERDLVGGLMDTKKIPIIAVINIRPEGPCVNTLVRLEEVEKAILHFIGE